MNRPLLLSAALLLGATAVSAAAPLAVADPSRPAADRARDADRKPAAMLAFAGVKPGMTVVDIMPGGGYFTRLFSTAVGPKGKVIAYVPDEVLARAPKMLDGVKALAAEPGHANVVPTHDPMMADGPSNMFDVVWTSQNYHDFHNAPNADLVGFNRLVYKSLKPGGVYVVLDHAAKPGSGLADTRGLHRIDPAAVREEAEAAGFRYAGASRVLANPKDDHILKVSDPTLRGHTDQFVLKFRKPG